MLAVTDGTRIRRIHLGVVRQTMRDSCVLIGDTITDWDTVSVVKTVRQRRVEEHGDMDTR